MTTISTKPKELLPSRSLDRVKWLQQKNSQLQKELDDLKQNYAKLQEDFAHVIKQFELK